MSGGEQGFQSMVDLLRRGAILTQLSCPAFSSPLFRLKGGDPWCSQCQKQVIVVKEGEKEPLLSVEMECYIIQPMPTSRCLSSGGIKRIGLV